MRELRLALGKRRLRSPHSKPLRNGCAFSSPTISGQQLDSSVPLESLVMAPPTNSDIHEIESKVLQLEPLARAALAKALLASLDALSDEEYEQLWAEEAEARYADFVAGRTTAVDGDDVFARARTRSR
jgi:hypothetical protein